MTVETEFVVPQSYPLDGVTAASAMHVRTQRLDRSPAG